MFVPWMIFLTQVVWIPQTLEVRIGAADCSSGKTLRVSVARNELEQRVGYGGRTQPLSAGEGKLFFYPNPQPVTFWMKDVHVPLSIGFFGERGQYLGDAEMPVESDPSRPQVLYQSPGPVTAVIEAAPETFETAPQGLCVRR